MNPNPNRNAVISCLLNPLNPSKEKARFTLLRIHKQRVNGA